ncbi:MAG: GNAT family N-acetyltransferase [Gemmatimonadetes bacterium]|nr:GNAT family N-acetyltransferase [Gemmatimonadota bacterium]
MQNVTIADGIVIRPLGSHAEREEAVRLEEETWGAGFSEKVPAAILLVAERIGGVAAAAFARDGRMLGFVFGLTGTRGGTLIHWSDILAVRLDAQGRGIGRALKQYQRERCRNTGVERMLWTFDPFVARNAHLNLNILGARIATFERDMYGTSTNSPVHGSLGTDRFIAEWDLRGEARPMPSDPLLLTGVPVAGGSPGDGPDASTPLPSGPSVVVRIPHDYSTVLAGDISHARAWRASARRAFEHYLAQGYCVSAFVPGNGADAAYLLSST